MAIQKSLVLVTVDCLRADHVSFMGYQRPTTPFLDSMATESFVFPTAIVGGAPTYYSFPSILASRYPLALGRDQIGLAPGEATLATILKEAGYATAAFCAGNPYLSRRFGYEQGFDKFEDHLRADPISANGAGPSASADSHWISRLNRKLESATHRLSPLGAIYDELYFQYCQRWGTPRAGSLDELRRFPAADVLVSQGIEWLDSVSDTPFFLWLHFMDPHSPYYPKQAALQAMQEGEMTPDRARYLNSYWNRSDLQKAGLSHHRNEIVRMYDAGVRWVDTQVARLVAHLEKLNRWNNCMFTLTADHGEEFLDHGGRYHPPDRLMEELIHVPLLLRVPGTAVKQLSKSPFSLLHLAPTLLDAAGRQSPEAFEGRSYWPQMQKDVSWDAAAIAESVAGSTNPFQPRDRLGPRVLAVREARFKLVLHFEPRKEELYDLEADPGEQSPLSGDTEKAVRRRLLEIARTHLRRSATERDAHPRLRSRLRELQLEWSNDRVARSLPA